MMIYYILYILACFHTHRQHLGLHDVCDEAAVLYGCQGSRSVGQCCRECNKLISEMVAVTAVLATSVTTMLMQ